MADYRMAQHHLLRSTLLLLSLLLVPIIPFVLFGDQSEAWFQRTIIDNSSLASNTLITMSAVVVALVVDILLPVPATGVLAFSGAALGLLTSTLTGWLALNLASAIGRWLGLRFGLPLARKLCSEETLAANQSWLDRFGPWMLAGTRGLPVLAEATILLAGVYRMADRKFWPPVLAANLIVAAVYSALGHYASEHDRLGLALLASVLLPMILLALWLMFSNNRKVSPQVD